MTLCLWGWRQAAPTVSSAGSHRATHTVLAAALLLPFRAGVIDAVLAPNLLSHLSSTRRRARALAEILRVLAVGGRALLTVAARELAPAAVRALPSQDVLIPPLIPPHSAGNAPETPREETPACYFHMFEAGELEALVASLGACVHVESFASARQYGVVLGGP